MQGWRLLTTRIGIHVFKRYAVAHSYNVAFQFLNIQYQDMTIPSDPDQILASLLTVNDIREDNRECSGHTAIVYRCSYTIQELYISNPR